MRTSRLYCYALLVVCLLFPRLSDAQNALFDWTFEGDARPLTSAGVLNVGQGLANCFDLVDNNDVVSLEVETDGSEAIATLDTSEWDVTGACFSFAGWGANLGHDLDRQQLTSSDLSEYTLSFDAWLDGTDDLNTGRLRMQFFEDAELRTEVENSTNPGAGQLGPLSLTGSRQTFSTTLDKLDFSGAFSSFDLEEHLGNISAVNFELDVEGVSGELSQETNLVVGVDAGNQLRIDNVKLVAPFEEMPSLTLLNEVVNNHGGTAAPNAWTLMASNDTTSLIGNSGGDDITNVSVPIGTYDLVASGGPDGYDMAGVSCVGTNDTDLTDGLSLSSGESALCTFTQDDIPPRLTLAKDVINDDGGSVPDSSWTLSAAGAGANLSGAEGAPAVTNAEVSAGTYQLSESDVPGYQLTGVSCSGADGNPIDGLALGLGEVVTCTLTSDDIAPTITLQKQVINDNGGTAADSEWTLSAVGSTASVNGKEGEAAVTQAPIPAGTYAVVETSVVGYEQTVVTCAGANDSDLSDGLQLGLAENAVCTLVSDDIPATLTLQTAVTNNSGGSATAEEFAVAATGASSLFGQSGSEAVSNVETSAGDYSVRLLAGVEGYEVTGVSCTGAADQNLNDGLALGLAENVTCTIAVDDIAPSLTLQASVVNDSGGSATATDWTLVAGGVVSIAGASGSDAVTSAELAAGTYTLLELDGPEGYELSDLSCVGGADLDLTDGLTLGLGESAVCTYVFNDPVVETGCDPNTQGDVNGDGVVDFADFLVMSVNFGNEVSSHEEGDINCDGEVSFADFLVQSVFFGQDVSGAQSVPEPTSGWLVVVGVLMVGAVRKRRRR